MNRLRLVILLSLLCIAAVLPALGNKEKNQVAATVVQVTGKVRLVGSGPMPELVITGPDKEWYIDREEEHKLKDMQHRTVAVEGTETVIELKFANGMSAGERRTLKKIKIISSE